MNIPRGWITCMGTVSGRDQKENLLNMPLSLESMFDYSTFSFDYSKGEGLSQMQNLVKLDFPVGTGKNFGELLPLTFLINEPSVIGLNTVPFPWTSLYINGDFIEFRRCLSF